MLWNIFKFVKPLGRPKREEADFKKREEYCKKMVRGAAKQKYVFWDPTFTALSNPSRDSGGTWFFLRDKEDRALRLKYQREKSCFKTEPCAPFITFVSETATECWRVPELWHELKAAKTIVDRKAKEKKRWKGQRVVKQTLKKKITEEAHGTLKNKLVRRVWEWKRKWNRDSCVKLLGMKKTTQRFAGCTLVYDRDTVFGPSWLETTLKKKGIRSVQLPPRSPDLSVPDYWAHALAKSKRAETGPPAGRKKLKYEELCAEFDGLFKALGGYDKEAHLRRRVWGVINAHDNERVEY